MPMQLLARQDINASHSPLFKKSVISLDSNKNTPSSTNYREENSATFCYSTVVLMIEEIK
jgi:hypothetical protein